MKIKDYYTCKENDNKVKIILEDGEVDEIWVQDPLENGWTVIGWKDLQEAIKQAKEKQ